MRVLLAVVAVLLSLASANCQQLTSQPSQGLTTQSFPNYVKSAPIQSPLTGSEVVPLALTPTGSCNGVICQTTTGAIANLVGTSSLLSIANTWLAIQNFSVGIKLGGGTTVTSVSGTASKLATVSGSLTNGHCITPDSNGNLIDGGAACISSSSGVNAGTIGQAGYYAASGSVISGTSVGALTYTATGSTTARAGNDRANDHGVNILDFGADPTGAADSTAAIQAAIDSMNGTSKKYVFCPDGIYQTKLPIYVDAPGNLRSGPAWSSGTTYSVGNIVTSSGIAWKSLTNSNLNNTPSITSTAWTPWVGTATIGAISWSFSGNPPSMGTGNSQSGCSIQPQFNNAPAIIMGTGDGNVLANLNITFRNTVSPNDYRGTLPPLGIGVAIAGDGFGAQRTSVENVEIDNFYTGILTGFGVDGLGAENHFSRVTITNCFQGIILQNSQNFINDVESSNVGCGVDFIAAQGHGMAVRDTNPSSTQGQSNIFTIGTVSLSEVGTSPPVDTVTATLSGGSGNNGTITTDKYILGCQASTPSNAGCVYSAWILNLPGFGPVPMSMITYNYSTHVATFNINPDWRQGRLRWNEAADSTIFDLKNEIQAATSIYAVELDIVFKGIGFHANNMHLENGISCTTFANLTASFGGDYGNDFKAIHLNQTPGGDEHNNLNNSQSSVLFGFYLCQQSNPFIAMSDGSADSTFEAWGWGQGDSPFVISYFTSSGAPRCRFISSGANGSVPHPVNPTQFSLSGSGQTVYDSVQGYCDWDTMVYGPSQRAPHGGSGNLIVLGQQLNAGGQYGFFPKGHPRLPVDTFTTWQSITGSNGIGTYPVAYANAIYDVFDPVTNAGLPSVALPAPARMVQSAHQFASFGRNITTSDWAGLSWSYVAGGNAVMADSTTLATVFPGLEIQLTDSVGPVTTRYVVTSVVPWDSLDGGTHPGFFTVCNMSAASSGGGINSWAFSSNNCVTEGIVGNTITGTTIGQDPYIWSQIGSQVPLGTPVLSTCGTSPALTAGSLNTSGSFTTGSSGTPTACTLTFSTAFQNLANCTISAANTAANGITGGTYVSAQSKSAFTITLGTGTNSAKYNYVCSGN